jgi:tRNA-dihydrouridine synthase B
VQGRVWIAPMTGVSDLPFRETASRLGAAYVATEMVACAEFARGRPDVVRRAAVGEGLPLMVIQLVGRDPGLHGPGRPTGRRAGAQIIDLNFGCPGQGGHRRRSRGSALMREPELAQALVAAAVDAVDVPVTVKMRLGWDDDSRNAADIAARAEAPGPRRHRPRPHPLPVLQGRGRLERGRGGQGGGLVPVIVNGDIVDGASARAALDASGADAVMIGRGVYGRPWIAAQIEADPGRRGVLREPDAEERLAIAVDPLPPQPAFYGPRLGLRMFRKHLAAYIDAAPWPASAEAGGRRARPCAGWTIPPPSRTALAALWLDQTEAGGMSDHPPVIAAKIVDALKAAAFDLSPEPALVVDRDGALVAVNEAAEALFGQGLSLLARGRFRAALPPGSALVSLLNRALRRGPGSASTACRSACSASRRSRPTAPPPRWATARCC